MKLINIEMEWTDTGCKMHVEGDTVLPCPVCGEQVKGDHTCGDKAPKLPKKTRKVSAK